MVQVSKFKLFYPTAEKIASCCKDSWLWMPFSGLILYKKNSTIATLKYTLIIAKIKEIARKTKIFTIHIIAEFAKTPKSEK